MQQSVKMPQIIFIINSIQAHITLKRIAEFIENGYDVKAYGFSRETEVHTKPKGFEVKVIGSFPNTSSKLYRTKIMYNAIKEVYKENRSKDCVYYYFGLDIAMISRCIIPNKYMYEEADLAHTYIGNSILRNFLDVIDKKIIRKSLCTVLTSEGFSEYHFGENPPQNISIIPNRLNKSILDISEMPQKQNLDLNKLRIGFVGGARFESILNFADVFSHSFPNHEFHFFGNVMSNKEQYEQLAKRSNVFFHGSFKNPDDLPVIYSQIDLVLSTYDVKFDNVKYAEPNKIYEAMYFNTPIIVSKGTFLGKKVSSLNIGFAVNALDDNEIKSFVNSLTEQDIIDKVNGCKIIDKRDSVDINTDFFQKLKSVIS